MKSVTDFNVQGKRVLVRCDFNVPLNADGSIGEDFKIRQGLPTLQYLLDRDAKVVAMTHLGDGHESLEVVQQRLDELLRTHIELLENLRKNPGEIANDPEFAKQLASHGDIFINDAFAECHRPYASIIGVPNYLPHGAGLLLQKEVENLQKILQNPARPLVAIIGGAKVGTKASFVEKISTVADTVLLGNLIRGVPGEDLEPEMVKTFTEKIMQAKTIFWNGPLGKFEDPKYATGTRAIAKAIIASDAFSVVGGGETIEFLRQEGMLDKFGWVSTAGGAMLEFLSGEELPGLKALEI